ncbi:restriction endonuclease subunit S [Anaerostipes hadrus]|jgi:type I restriction enzyme S subunit|uniref:restriction endonuclease subunit S n=1 Tax=Anaerostipes hadrus TaxID=649756 RepID=UPI0027D8AA8E|nr:restriction endonuclease subunit S [Anaerostipes hadrus]WMD26414.1 restriction endonuclease subunit S [Anaerostipes hadrus]
MARVKLEDVCERGSSNLKQSDVVDKDGDYPIYGASGYIGNVDFYHQEQPYVAVVKDGAGIGRTTLHPAKSSVIGTMQYLLPKGNVLPEYLCYVVKYMHLEKYFTGATIPHIYFKDYKNEEFNLDSLDRQKEIVSTLNKIEKVIESRTKELELLDELIRARFVELFGNPLDGTAKYPIHQVGEVANSVDPQPSHRTPPVEEGGIPYVSIKDCDYKTGKIDFEGARKVSLKVLEEHMNRYTLHDGDFVVGKIGTIGNPVFVPVRNDYTLSANVVLIQPNSELVSPYFLKYSFESDFVERQFAEAKNSTSQAAFGIQKVRTVEVMNPDLDVQREFEIFVKQVDKSKFEIQKSLEKTQLLFDSLMQEYFG